MTNQTVLKPVAPQLNDRKPSTNQRGKKHGSKKRSHVAARLLHATGLLGFGVAIIVVWQLIYSAGLVSKFVLPSPLATAVELWSMVIVLFSGGYIFWATLYTLQEIIYGFLITTVIGILLGVIAGDTRFGENILMPYLVAINAMPRIAFAPVFVAWLGFGMEPKIMLAAFIAFFPVVINTALGVQSCNTNSLLLFKSLSAGRWKTLWKLKLPTALPSIFAGLKTAMILCVVGAVVAEFLGGSANGVGQLINIAAQQLAISSVFSLIIILSVVGLVLYNLLVLVERRIVYWRTTEQKAN